MLAVAVLAGGGLSLVHGSGLGAVAGITCVLCISALARRRWDLARQAAALALLVLALVAPWTLRNWNVYGGLVPVGGNPGLSYFIGNVWWGLGPGPPRSGEGVIQAAFRHSGVETDREVRVSFAGISDVAIDRELNRAMLRDVLESPERLAIKLVLNGLEFYFPVVRGLLDRLAFEGALSSSDNPRSWLRPVAQVPASLANALLWIAALAGLFLHGRSGEDRRRRLVLVGLTGALALPYLPFVAVLGGLPSYSHASLAVLSTVVGAALATASSDSGPSGLPHRAATG